MHLLTNILLSTCYHTLPVDVASGNHHTYVLRDGVVLSMGQDLHQTTAGGKGWIGGKLGREIDKNVFPGRDPNSIPSQADYNPSPSSVRGLEGRRVINVASGQNDGAAITQDGRLLMWGPNNHGQLGLGDTIPRRSATEVLFPAEVLIKDVAIGAAHTLAVTRDGRAFSFGLGHNGVLGHGNTRTLLSPTRIQSLAAHNIVQVAAGQNTHSLFLTDMGQLFICGINSSSLLGLGLPERKIISEPSLLDTHSRFKTIAVGVKTSFAISEDGRLYGWGNGRMGHFARRDTRGSPDLSDLQVPTLLAEAPPDLIQVVAGSRHVAVLDNAGRIFSWGTHTAISGQLGIGPVEHKSEKPPYSIIFVIPQRVIIPDNKRVRFLDSITNNVFAVTTDGQIYGWGQTAHGRLGYPVNGVHSIRTPDGKIHHLAHSPVPIPRTAETTK